MYQEDPSYEMTEKQGVSEDDITSELHTKRPVDYKDTPQFQFRYHPYIRQHIFSLFEPPSPLVSTREKNELHASQGPKPAEIRFN